MYHYWPSDALRGYCGDGSVHLAWGEDATYWTWQFIPETPIQIITPFESACTDQDMKQVELAPGTWTTTHIQKAYDAGYKQALRDSGAFSVCYEDDIL